MVVKRFDATEAATLYPRLAWFNERCFTLVGSAATSSSTPSPSASAMAAFARHLGEHAQWWRGVVPESVLLAPLVAEGPPDDEAAALLDELAAADDLEPLVGDRLVPYLHQRYTELVERLPAHAEGAALRVGRSALADLDTFVVSRRG